MTPWERLAKEFKHAFALTPTGSPYSAEDDALLQKIAALIVKRGMAAPTLLFLESVGPLNFLGSQVVHGLKPFLDLVCDPMELDRLASMLERRASVDKLITLIQEATNSLT
ncbi:MAG: hypothetical protein AB7P69_21425 [Candidatus Binatia bacterium]